VIRIKWKSAGRNAVLGLPVGLASVSSIVTGRAKSTEVSHIEAPTVVVLERNDVIDS
jgi:hypothetical protein